MEKLRIALLVALSLAACVLAQSPQKIADINKKIVGKWWASDGKNYIEFLANGSCFEGALWPDGKWHVEKGQLSAWEKGDDFRCSSGGLTLVSPNVFTRDYGMGGDVVKYYRGSQPPPKTEHTLTVPLAERILTQQINMPTVKNTLLTCRACYDPDDKDENDRAPLVSDYSGPLIPFLIAQGHIRTVGQQQVFSAKAKRSSYYGAENGTPGFRFANFKNPSIAANKITDLRRVPIEYDFVPTGLTLSLFGKIQRVKSFVSFSYENDAWEICIECRQ